MTSNGYCQCGCGAKTKISKWTNKKRGSIAGEPNKFIFGHDKRKAFAVKFWAKVDKTGPCWVWLGATRGKYGILRMAGANYSVHRISWELKHGEIPSGQGYHGNCVLHKCDNTLCVNPDHLFLGTQSENMGDCAKKGRIVSNPNRGTDSNLVKLVEKEVLEIRSLAICENQKKLALRYGVSQQAISKIILKQRWTHI